MGLFFYVSDKCTCFIPDILLFYNVMVMWKLCESYVNILNHYTLYIVKILKKIVFFTKNAKLGLDKVFKNVIIIYK